ncbi:MAG: hypothetical protein BGP09_19805 [Rhizobium sp. 60-20]|nr:MAG: hypothetical protein BGP09_19805 [Rhizobium sp. 60-20]
MIAIHWFGPFKSLDDARQSAKEELGSGLYMCTGRVKSQRSVQLQYIGIGGTVHTRLVNSHHKLSEVTDSRQIWLGQPSSAEPSGKKLKMTQATLDYAEWLHAHFLKLPLNEKKTRKPPERPVTVLNRWFKTNYETPYRNRPHPDWPDLVDYPWFDDMPTRLVWFGGKQRLLPSPSYRVL